jgi:hypothetical protein
MVFPFQPATYGDVRQNELLRIGKMKEFALKGG